MSVDYKTLRKILEQATPGPYTVDNIGGEFRLGDALALVESFNAMPALLDRLAKLERVAEAARDKVAKGWVDGLSKALAALDAVQP